MFARAFGARYKTCLKGRKIRKKIRLHFDRHEIVFIGITQTQFYIVSHSWACSVSEFWIRIRGRRRTAPVYTELYFQPYTTRRECHRKHEVCDVN